MIMLARDSLSSTSFPKSEFAKTRDAQDVGGKESYNIMMAEIGNMDSVGGNVSMELFERPTMLDILKEIASKMPDEMIAVNEVRLLAQRNGTRLEIKGEVKDTDQFGSVLNELKQTTLFTINEEALVREIKDNKETFTIQAML